MASSSQRQSWSANQSNPLFFFSEPLLPRIGIPAFPLPEMTKSPRIELLPLRDSLPGEERQSMRRNGQVGRLSGERACSGRRQSRGLVVPGCDPCPIRCHCPPLTPAPGSAEKDKIFLLLLFTITRLSLQSGLRIRQVICHEQENARLPHLPGPVIFSHIFRSRQDNRFQMQPFHEC